MSDGVETSPSRIQAAVIDDERVAVEAERKYRDVADELERKLGPHLTPMPQVHAIADDMLARRRQIVDAWAEATNTDKETAYGKEFVFPTGTK